MMEKRKRARLIYNPTSGQEIMKKNVAEVLNILEGFGYETSAFQTTPAKDSAKNEAARAAKAGFDLVIAAGGDGTINEVVNGIAHITGGGFIENVPRMFADDLAAEIDEGKVPVLPIFKALEKYGEIKHEEMFEIFNMGIGLMLAVSPENVDRVKALLDEPVYEIGRIVKKADASVVIK